MPSVNEKQRRLMCLAWGIKTGKQPPSSSREAAKIAETMTAEQLKEYCTSEIKKG